MLKGNPAKLPISNPHCMQKSAKVMQRCRSASQQSLEYPEPLGVSVKKSCLCIGPLGFASMNLAWCYSVGLYFLSVCLSLSALLRSAVMLFCRSKKGKNMQKSSNVHSCPPALSHFSSPRLHIPSSLRRIQASRSFTSSALSSSLLASASASFTVKHEQKAAGFRL